MDSSADNSVVLVQNVTPQRTGAEPRRTGTKPRHTTPAGMATLTAALALTATDPSAPTAATPAAAASAAKARRKRAALNLVAAALDAHPDTVAAATWRGWLHAYSKRDDLADAMLMATRPPDASAVTAATAAGHTEVVVAGFDLGIRNLALCVAEHAVASGAAPAWRLRAWLSVDLQAGGVASKDARKCSACHTRAATWQDAATAPATTAPAPTAPAAPTLWCTRCVTPAPAVVRGRRGAATTAVVAVTKPRLPCAGRIVAMRALAKADAVAGSPWPQLPPPRSPVAAWLNAAAPRYLLPWKAVKATSMPLHDVCTALDAWLDGGALATLASAHLIRLENQPSYLTMKSVQMMLYALLLHRLRREHDWRGAIVMVHASQKTKVRGDADPSEQG